MKKKGKMIGKIRQFIVIFSSMLMCVLNANNNDVPVYLMQDGGTITDTESAVLYVDGSVTNNESDGLSWATAKKTIDAAILLATTAGQEIWVKSGEYQITSQITIGTSINLLGGFAGTETANTSRDHANNKTTIKQTAQTAGDATRVFNIIAKNVTIDGFTIDGGKLSITSQENVSTPARGAGIYCNQSGLVVKNCEILNCTITATHLKYGLVEANGAGIYAAESLTIENTKMKNITMRGTRNAGGTTTLEGGVIYAGADINVKDCEIEIFALSATSAGTDARSKITGGAIYLNGDAEKSIFENVKVKNGTIEIIDLNNSTNASPRNKIVLGGGVYAQNSVDFKGVNIEGIAVTVNSNGVPSGSHGSLAQANGVGIYLNNGASNLENINISKCTATVTVPSTGNAAKFANASGVGIYFNTTTTTNNVMSNVNIFESKMVCTIGNNGTRNFLGNGGAIYIGANLALTNCNFSGNTSYSDGGAIYVAENVTLSMKNSIIANNESLNGDGGGVYSFATASNEFINCTIARNKISTGKNGGGIVNGTLKNSALYENLGSGDAVDNAKDVTATFSAYSGGFTATEVDTNFLVNPPDFAFTSPTETAGTSGYSATADWNLSSSSSLINAGDNSAWTGNTDAKDLAGNSRIWNSENSGIVDVGAYEFQDKGVINISFNSPIKYTNAVQTPNYLYPSNMPNDLTPTFSYTKDTQTVTALKDVGTYTIAIASIDTDPNWIVEFKDNSCEFIIEPAVIKSVIFSLKSDQNNTSVTPETHYSLSDHLSYEMSISTTIDPTSATLDTNDFTLIYYKKNGDGIYNQQGSHPTNEGSSVGDWKVVASITNNNYIMDMTNPPIDELHFTISSAGLPTLAITTDKDSNYNLNEDEKIEVTMTLNRALDQEIQFTVNYDILDFDQIDNETDTGNGTGGMLIVFEATETEKKFKLKAKTAKTTRTSVIKISDSNVSGVINAAAKDLSINIIATAAEDYVRYVTITGAGYKTGKNWENAAEGLAALKTFSADTSIKEVHTGAGVYVDKTDEVPFLRADYHVVGRWANWKSDDRKIEMKKRIEKMELIIFFAPLVPNASGIFTLNDNFLPELARLKEMKSPGSKILLGLGDLSPVMNNDEATATMADNVVKLCLEHGFDGIDVDWEDQTTPAATYARVIKAIAEKSKPANLILANSVGTNGQYQAKTAAANQYLDYIHIQFYYRERNSSSVNEIAGILKEFENRGIPKAKLLVGLPVYGMRRTGDARVSLSYSEMINNGANPNENAWRDPRHDIEYLYSGLPLIRAKVEYARLNGYAGVFTWDPTMDADYDSGKSILRVMDEASGK